MLIEVRHKAVRVEGALVFAKALYSLVPKPRTEFFGSEGPVRLIHTITMTSHKSPQKLENLQSKGETSTNIPTTSSVHHIHVIVYNPIEECFEKQQKNTTRNPKS